MVRALGGTDDLPSACHLTEPVRVQALVDLAVRECGRIDVACSNNAAMGTFNWLEDIHQRGMEPDLREERRPVFFSHPGRRGHI